MFEDYRASRRLQQALGLDHVLPLTCGGFDTSRRSSLGENQGGIIQNQVHS